MNHHRVLIAAFAGLIFSGGCGSSPGQPTLSYWQRLAACGAITAANQSDPRSQAIANYRAQAEAIEQLASKNVDLEAVRVGLDGAALLREYAQLLNSGEDLPLAMFVDGFVFGYTGTGNPFASAIQYNSSVQNWGFRYSQWVQRTHQVRAILTSRYGIEFPSIIKPSNAGGATGSISTPASQPLSWWGRLSFGSKVKIVLGAIIGAGLLLKSLAKPTLAGPRSLEDKNRH